MQINRYLVKELRPRGCGTTQMIATQEERGFDPQIDASPTT